MNKKDLSEADICDLFITPAVQRAGWDPATQVRREHYCTDGQVLGSSRLATRGKHSYVVYRLSHGPGLPIAILEAKNNRYAIGGGVNDLMRGCDQVEAALEALRSEAVGEADSLVGGGCR